MVLKIGQQLRTNSVSSHYTCNRFDDLILVDASAGDVNITLPIASEVQDKAVQVMKIDSSINIVNILTQASETINGQSSSSVGVPYSSIVVVSDGINFVKINDDVKIAQSETKPNLLINGAFDFWQRNTTFSAYNGLYCADRWWASRLATGNTTTQQTSPNGIGYALRMQRDNGNALTQSLQLSYIAETKDSIQYRNKTMTLSFLARKGANFSGSFSASIFSTTNVDGSLGTDGLATNRTEVQTESITLGTGWQKFTFTGILPNDMNQFFLLFKHSPTGTAGADDWFEIAEIMFIEGTHSNPEFKRIGKNLEEELAFCQRYYEVVRAGGSSYFGGGGSNTGTGAYSVTKRATPTVGNISKYYEYPSSSTWLANNITTNGFKIYRSGGGTLTFIDGDWTADAEL